jgi:hypothetical protein
MLDNPQTNKEIPAAYMLNRTERAIGFAAGFADGKIAKQKQIVEMIQNIRQTWVRPNALNFDKELRLIIEKIESLDEQR